jgi:hypothetical protein
MKIKKEVTSIPQNRDFIIYDGKQIFKKEVLRKIKAGEKFYFEDRILKVSDESGEEEFIY